MDRRRRSADTDSGSRSGSPTLGGTARRKSDAIASPVRQDLKAVAMGSDLQAAMERRRRISSGIDTPDLTASTATTDNVTSSQATKVTSNLGAKIQKGSSSSRRNRDDHSSEGTDEKSVSGQSMSSADRGRRGGTIKSSSSRSSTRDEGQRRRGSGGGSESGLSEATTKRRPVRRSSSDEPDDKPPTPGLSSSSLDGDSKKAKSKSGSEDDKSRKKTTSRKSSQKDLMDEEKKPAGAPPKAPPKNRLTRGGRRDSQRSIGSGTSEEGWGDSVAPFGGSTHSSVAAAGTGDGFENLDTMANFSNHNYDPAFDAFANFDAKATTAATTASPDKKNLTKSDFDSAFAPVAFDAFGSGAFATAGGASMDFGGDFAFSSLAPVQESPPARVWDKTPLQKVPARPVSKPSLSLQPVLNCEFESRPCNNPLNGNIIMCCAEMNSASQQQGQTTSKGEFYLREIDPRQNNVQIMSTPILTLEFKRKVTAKYNASVHRVDSVLALTTGLQHVNGQTRTRVAAILDLAVLESRQILRVVAVWQWGWYSSGHTTSATTTTTTSAYHQAISLQYTITPPSGKEFSFDSSTLQVADGLLFLAGASPKGPCIFMCKPVFKETWSANFLGGSGRVTCMAVTSSLQRNPAQTSSFLPFLAIALDEGSLNVWTYSSALAVTANSSKNDTTASKRWLFPFCQLEYVGVMEEIEAASPLSETGEATGKDSKELGRCTHLEWLPPQPAISSLTLIAAAFQNGLAIFHVNLPVIEDQTSKEGFRVVPEPTQGTNLLQAPPLYPLVAKRWQGKHEHSCLTWFDFGTTSCLALLLHGSDGDRVVLGTLNFPMFQQQQSAENFTLVPFQIFSSKTLTESEKKTAPTPVGFLRSSGIGNVFAFSSKQVLRVTFADPKVALRTSEGTVAALTLSVASPPHGLSSAGDPLLAADSMEQNADSDGGVFHIFTVLQCQRQKSRTPPLLEWSHPAQRHWLCRTVSNVKKTAADQKEDDFMDDEKVFGGADSDVVCELFHPKLVGHVPFRITQCNSKSLLCAVSYRKGINGGKTSLMDVSLDATYIAFVVDDDSNKANMGIKQVIAARDVAFLPGEVPRGVILSSDGSTLTYFSWNAAKGSCKMGKGCRPIAGVEVDKDFIDCRRVFAFTGAGKVVLAAVATRSRNKRSTVVIGELGDIKAVTEERWSDVLPNIEMDRSCWLEEDEELFAMIGLEGDDSGYRNFAASTSFRVVILSSAMTISAQAILSEPCSSLAPMGPFAVSYTCANKLHYLCCLDGDLALGTICSFPLPKHGYSHRQLVSVQPDRCLVREMHFGTRLVECGQNPNIFMLPTAVTFPALLLEPLIANAVCVGGKQSVSTPILRTVIERFGRKIGSITHGDHEGIGLHGAGLSARVFEILGKYGLKHASTWLLTGTVNFERSANTRILPPWLPVPLKAKGGINIDVFLHLISNGDQYLNDYLKSPDQNMASTLPRQNDPTAYFAREYAMRALGEGKSADALKLLDLVGSEVSETTLVQLALMLEKGGNRDTSGLLKIVSGYNDSFRPTSVPARPPSSFAALSVFLKESRGKPMSKEQVQRWMKPLAPSLQSSTRSGRIRQKLIGEKDLAAAAGQSTEVPDPFWVSPCSEAKHVWNEGPRKEKENLLLLDKMEDWMGRRRPLILGKEGATAAGDRGEKTLADLLNQNDDDSFGGMSAESEKENSNWVEGVGEGRSDEANLSGYFRMSEGEDEESLWSSEGLQDLSPYHNKLIIVGDAADFSLQPSTSSVDEGEPGKVKSLYDLVFESSGAGVASGLALRATRGSSIDVGVLQGADRQARKKCSLEFWFYLAAADTTVEELVLARRTMGADADDFEKVCMAAEKENTLWELVVLKSGELEFRSCGGSALLSSQNYQPPPEKQDDDSESSDEVKERFDVAAFERWNHVCIVLSSVGVGVAECTVTLFMKAKEVASSVVSMLPVGYEEEDLENGDVLDQIMQKSHILFGLGHSAGFRLTEIRIWACERTSEDIQSFLYEYLTAAEKKKKFQVKISNKNKGSGKGALLGGPKGGGGLAPPRGLMAKTGFTPAKAGGSAEAKKPSAIGMSLAPPPKEKFSLAPPKEEIKVEPPKELTPTGFEAAFGSFGQEEVKAEKQPKEDVAEISQPATKAAKPAAREKAGDEEKEGDVPATLWDTALPLSQQLRSSAAAALIRGPPATRHFGGNRGGLPDFSGMERFGVGGIAICGSEKTIVWRDNEDPPALTYPIGASGAVVSDQMDDMGSEFLCCFLAKERRMVVFELQSRTIVVELQMTTKLNFWRYLPPEAAENTLCFILITPVGGFHWMPLEESPRPHQVWKRGPDLQGKKVVSYEEGGSNGLDDASIKSRVGLVMVTKASGAGSLESWIIPIAGDSHAVQVSDDVMGSCLCQPPFVDDGPFLPLLVTVHNLEDGVYVNVLSVIELEEGSVELGEVEVTQMIDMTDYEKLDFESPSLAMGTFPEALCCSLSNIVVVIIRRKGLIAAFELEDDDLSLIAQEGVGHYVVDAVMRYSSEVGGAEIVMLLSDNENPKDGRIVSFCFRSAA